MNDIFDMPDDWKIVGNDEIAGMPTESRGLIITGLGGDEKQFRYFVAISSERPVLKSSFKTKVKKAFSSLFSQTDAKIEKITINPDHIRLILLISMENSIDEIVMTLIQKMNSDQVQLLEHYLVVNTNVPEDKEVQDYVDQTRKTLK